MAEGVKSATGVASAPLVRIGELSRRVGVRPETLRAWERRYGLLDPGRSHGGYRLYSQADEARVRTMTALLEQGISPAEAAKLARDAPHAAGGAGSGVIEAGRVARMTVAAPAVPPTPAVGGAGTSVPAPAGPPVADPMAARLLEAIGSFDDGAANAILDEALARLSIEGALSTVVLPAMREVGERWSRGELGIAEEHFCTELLRGRLLAAARGWGAGSGPLALLACPPGERHDVGLIAFGLALRECGWRIAFLGADVPVATVAETAERLDPAVVVVAAAEAARFESALRTLRSLGEFHALLVAGAGANGELARSLGAAHLEGDPIYAARWLAGERSPASP